jgi:outer membrane lipoprotein carrier protein
MKIDIRNRLAAIVLLAAVITTGQAAESEVALSAADARAVVADFMDSVSSYQADFVQVLSDAAGNVLEEEAGYFWLQKPGKFRWQYTDPWEREIIANLETIWVYDADLEQVTIRSVDEELRQTPAALLVGDAAALDDYNVSGIRFATGQRDISLTPTASRNNFRGIVLSFNKQGDITRLLMEDRLSQRTSIDFSRGLQNAEVDESIFVLAVPDGVDVLDQRAE